MKSESQSLIASLHCRSLVCFGKNHQSEIHTARSSKYLKRSLPLWQHGPLILTGSCGWSWSWCSLYLYYACT